MYVFGEHDAIGFSPFSIESYNAKQNDPLNSAYRTIKELAPLITKYQGTGAMYGLLFDQQDKEHRITFDDLTLTCQHFFTLPWDSRATDGSTWPEGGGIVIRLSQNEYHVAGSGIVIEFATTTRKATDRRETRYRRGRVCPKRWQHQQTVGTLQRPPLRHRQR